MNLEEFKKAIDPQIDSFIQSKINEIPNDKDYSFLKEYFEYLRIFIKDGKRIRSFISYLTYLSFEDKQDKRIINFLVFIEIFHYFCLIHDDVMDSSEQRHALKTINYKFGQSEAILIGDYLFFWAWEIVRNSNFGDKQLENVTKLFQEMIEDVFLGQALDVYTTRKETVSDDLILKKTLHKTAGYTFINPMLIGLALANKYTDKNKLLMQNIGENLGLAFQIQDDLLDITSDFNGKKTSLKDISEGTHTIFTNYILKNGTEKQKEILKRHFGKNIVNAKELRQIFYDSGAVSYGKEQIEKYLDVARKLADKYSYFLTFIDSLSQRSY